MSIAGYILKITFSKSDLFVDNREFKKMIFRYNGGFIVNKKPKKIDYELNFSRTNKMYILNKAKEVDICLYNKMNNHKMTTYYHISHLQFVFILRHIINQLIKNDGFVLHCSANLVKQNAYVFLGKSGAGKSTISSLLSSKFAILADDMGIIKKEGEKYFFYQGPFLERNYASKSPKGFILKKAFFIHKSKSNRISKIEGNTFIKKLLSQIWIEDESHEKRTIKNTLEFVSSHTHFYSLHFSKTRASSLSNLLNNRKSSS